MLIDASQGARRAAESMSRALRVVQDTVTPPTPRRRDTMNTTADLLFDGADIKGVES